jgi:glyoxalase/bleomycin resistance protein/dioxygenase superfamily protein
VTLSATRSSTVFNGIRYQVKDVARAVGFYTEHLGFQ